MSRFQSHDDARFEQALLNAERHSPDAPDVDHAWSRFRASVGVVGSGLEQASGVYDIQPGPPQRRPGGDAHASGSGGPSEPVAGLAAGKLLTLGTGAALGCLLTLAAGLLLEQPPPMVWPPQAAGASATRMSADEVPAPPSSPDVSPVEPPAPRNAPSTATPSGGSARAKDAAEGAARSALRSSHSQAAAEEVDSAQLSAEIQHLDWLRRLSASGEHGQVLRSVAKFHERFPRGVLAPEAEVLALRSLVALGKADELGRRATRFKRRYPESPHLQRVRDWGR